MERRDAKITLIAKAVLPASTRDMFGDSLGSFSALAMDSDAFQPRAGKVTARLFSLPDRGFNTPAKGQYSGYPGRIHQLSLNVALSGSRDATLSYERSVYLRDADGAVTTGLDPGKGRKQHFGIWAPAVKSNLALDAEGMARRAEGTFYVSDEFACAIYHVAADGQMLGVIPPPKALQPLRGGKPHFTSADEDPPKTGRQPNDGLEGLALSPDGRELWALMQSPVVQDMSEGTEAQRYVRLLIYDVAASPCPKRPKAHYLVELPLFGQGGKAKPAEANCVLPLGHGRFWVLARDGGGWGDRKGPNGKPRPVLFKQIMEGRVDPRADLAGTRYEKGTASILQKDRLRRDLRAIKLQLAVDLADEAALNGVGLTKFPPQKGLQQISAKWESMCLSPPITRGGQERLLFVGNDNDFLTRHGYMPDGRYDAKVDNPNMILIYRVMSP